MRLVAIGVPIFLASFMALLGLGLERGALSSELARPGRLLRGLALELILVPLTTVICLRALGGSMWVAAGLVAVAVAPGAPLSPHSARRAGGSASYALVLSTILGVLTAFTAAPSARWLLNYPGEVKLRPPLLLAELLVLQWLPLAAGILVRRWSSSRLVVALQRAMAALTIGSGLLLSVVILGRSLSLPRLVGGNGLAAVLLSMVVAVALGWLFGEGDDRLSRTFAATVSIPNVGLSLALAKGAGAPPIVVSTIVAIFLLRVAANLMLVEILRRTGRPRFEPVSPVSRGRERPQRSG